MKKYLFLAIALLGLASCAKEDLTNGNEPIHNGEIEESYIAINLTAADITRAEGGVYQDGTEAERAVKSAYFFFFDGDGDPFPVNVNEGAINNPGSTNGINYLQAVIDPTVGSETPNISDIKNAVLLLKTYQGDYPSQVVAVINWTPPTNKGYSIEELLGIMSNIRGDGNSFIMSNAVYADAGHTKANIGVPITAADIFKDETAAINDPITIHVERIAAKISVSTDNGNTLFNLNKKFEGIGLPVGANEIDVYAQILGWELYNDFSQSYLLKNIDPTWKDSSIGFSWNDPLFYRSYWASSIAYDKIVAANNGFKMTYDANKIAANGFFNKYGFTIGNYTNVSEGNYTDKAYTYVGENTNYVPGDAQNLCTKIILKAQLVQNVDETTYKPVEIARWYATEYAGKENLLIAVANTIKYKYYYMDQESGTPITIGPKDLTTVKGDSASAPANVKAYQVYFQLSNPTDGTFYGEKKVWYKKDNEGNLVELEDKDVNDELVALEPALLYENGETFYYVDVKHLPVGTDTQKQGEYGIVRNHIYNVKINSIGGYGSPIYIGDSYLKDPEYPIDPTDQGSFVSAEVRVLSWRLVNQTVDIQPQPQPNN